MLPLLLRIGLFVVGLGGLTEATVVAAVVSENPMVSDAVMYFGLLLIVLQAVISLGLIVGGLWLSIRDWAIRNAAS